MIAFSSQYLKWFQENYIVFVTFLTKSRFIMSTFILSPIINVLSIILSINLGIPLDPFITPWIASGVKIFRFEPAFSILLSIYVFDSLSLNSSNSTLAVILWFSGSWTVNSKVLSVVLHLR